MILEFTLVLFPKIKAPIVKCIEITHEMYQRKIDYRPCCKSPNAHCIFPCTVTLQGTATDSDKRA